MAENETAPQVRGQHTEVSSDDVLAHVNANPKQTARAIARALGAQPQVVQNTVERLHRAGKLRAGPRFGAGTRTYVVDGYDSEREEVEEPGPRQVVDERNAEQQAEAGRRASVLERPPANDGYDDMLVPDLRTFASDRGIEGTSSMKKAELIAALRRQAPRS
jgi:hypothetical protein